MKKMNGYLKMYLRRGHAYWDHYVDRGYVLEHHFVWWKNTGNKVPKGYCIHHENEDKSDNRFENLRLMIKTEHTAMHRIGKRHTEKARKRIGDSSYDRASVMPRDSNNQNFVRIKQS